MVIVAGINERYRQALTAVIAAGVVWSTTPLLVHLTARDIPAVLFNTFVLVANSVALMLLLAATKKRCLDGVSTGSLGLRWHFKYLETNTVTGAVEIRSTKLKQPATWFRTPLLWIVVGTPAWGFFAAGTHFVETSIVAVVWELWPVFVVFGMARLHLSKDNGGGTLTKRQLWLIPVAVTGLIVMLGSQTEGTITSPLDLLGFDAVTGICFAFIGSALASGTVIATFAYGKVMYHQLTQPDVSRISKSRSKDPGFVLLWFTMLGLLLARLCAIPFFAAVTAATVDLSNEVSVTEIAAGAMLFGFVDIGGAALLRVGNVLSARPAVNLLAFVSPMLALLWLMLVGIELPRFDWFCVGAVLILSVNILTQQQNIKPASKPPANEPTSAPPPTTRAMSNF